MTESTELVAEPSGSTEPLTIRLQHTRGFSRVLSPRELWHYRDLAGQIATRDLKVRYRQTALGVAWAILQPLVTMVVFSVFFGRLAGVPSQDGIPYPVFTLAALVPWTFFAGAVQLGSDSLVANGPLVSKIYFPRVFIPGGVVVAGLVDLAIGLVILLITTLAYGIVPGPEILLLPAFVLIAVLTAFGLTCFLSSLNVRYRDVRYVVPFLVQLGLFATPIAYAGDTVDQPWQTLWALNPMVGVADGFRWAVLGIGGTPWTTFAVSAVSALVIFIGGLAYFDRVERSFADLL